MKGALSTVGLLEDGENSEPHSFRTDTELQS